MKKLNPLDKAISQVLEILDFITENKDLKSDKPIPKHIESELDRLEMGVEMLREINDMTLKSSGISSDELKDLLQSPPDKLSPRDRRVVERAMNLKKVLKDMQKEVKIRARVEKEVQRKYGGTKDPKKARQKKFKKLGAKKNWKPI